MNIVCIFCNHSRVLLTNGTQKKHEKFRNRRKTKFLKRIVAKVVGIFFRLFFRFKIIFLLIIQAHMRICVEFDTKQYLRQNIFFFFSYFLFRIINIL